MRQGNGGLKPSPGQESRIAREARFGALAEQCRNSVVKRHSVDGRRLRKRVSVARFAALYPVGPVVVAHHCRRIPLLLRDIE